MSKLTKMFVLACFLSTLIYLVVPKLVGKSVAFAASNETAAPQENEPLCQCPDAKSDPQLPLPSSLAPNDLVKYQQILLTFVQAGTYKTWCVDKGIRDTGPYINGSYYGTHPAVRIYYSPGVMQWLITNRLGDIPDGAMIVKEMFGPPPAARYEGQNPPVTQWTVMMKDAKGSKDGWYWAGLWNGMQPDSYNPPFNVFNGGFGRYCTRCHATAEKEFTFSTLENIKGFPGQPLTFYDDESWRSETSASKSLAAHFPQVEDATHNKTQVMLKVKPPAKPNAAMLDFLKFTTSPPVDGVQTMPAESYDHVVSGPKGPEQFLTSDQCFMCHEGAKFFAPAMMIFPKTGPGINVSPYGEWRWSPMGLAGRDPIFFAQLDSELAYLDTIKPKEKSEQLKQEVINTCFRCHGVMGKRQFDIDNGYNPSLPADRQPNKEPNFKLEFVYNTNQNNPDFKYGALARDGISCASCHHIIEDKTPPNRDPLKYFLRNSITGLFKTGPPDELYGPFEDKTISTLPMNNTLGIKPKHDKYVLDSRLCGSCHTIDLPIIDKMNTGVKKPAGGEEHGDFSLEQVTYLEWLNSKFQTEFNPGPDAQSCQACHMPGSYSNPKRDVSVDPIKTKIAIVEDDSYPATTNRAEPDQIRVRFREKDFVRHQLQGLNLFLLEMFNQQPTILGVNLADYMTNISAMPDAIENMVRQAQTQTATITVSQPVIDNKKLIADVTLQNKTGHRFPSGVGFRRGFIEFEVIDPNTIDPNTKEPKVLWASGSTNEAGVIVDNKGEPLITEYIGTKKNPSKYYQPHFYAPAKPGAPSNPITDSTQAQIYEELTKDANGNFTTSFIRRDQDVKDNRLLPEGWTEQGPAPGSLEGRYLKSTHPIGTGSDINYTNQGKPSTSVVRYEVPLSALPAGTDPTKLAVKATLYYQTIPPYYLMQRYEGAPNAPATQRLLYLTSRLDVANTHIQNWRLKIAAAPPVAVAQGKVVMPGDQRRRSGVGKR